MKIIFLLGPSSAGKSTLCKELVIQHHWHSMSIDEVMLGYYRKPNPKIDPIMTTALAAKNLLEKLSPYLSESDVLKLCKSGTLNLTRGPHPIDNVAFSSPDLVGIEAVLEKSGFAPDEIHLLASQLREITQLGESIYTQNPMDDPLKMLLAKAFHEDNEGKSIILDLIPTAPGAAKDLLNELLRHAEEFKTIHPEIVCEVYPILAFIPPEALSQRINIRNKTADTAGDLTDKRIGLFPFEQLSAFMDERGQSHPGLSVSKDQMFQYVQHHSWLMSTGALKIENPFDPNAMEIQDEIAPIVVDDHGLVRINLTDDLSSTSMEYSSARIGTESQLDEFRELTRRFKFGLNQEQVKLRIADPDAYSLIIDMSQGTPMENATLILNTLEGIQVKPSI